MSVTPSCETLWRKRLNALSAVWPDFLDGQTKGLHKARVATRRIREALPIVGAENPPSKVKKLGKKMREVTRHLGPIRELDVELGMLDDESMTEALSKPALAMVRREVASRRHALRRELEDKPPVSDLRKLLKKLERVGERAETVREEGKGERGEGRGEKGEGRGPRGEGKRNGKNKRAESGNSRHERTWRAVLAARLLRRAKKLGAAVEEAGPLYVPARIHDVRIATKKLRYALEIACELNEPAAAPLVAALKKHQTRLGRLHDLQSLLKHVREAEATPGVGSHVNELTAYADRLERECRRLHAEFVEQRGTLVACVKEVRSGLVPALTTPNRPQAHVSRPRRSAMRSARTARTAVSASRDRAT